MHTDIPKGENLSYANPAYFFLNQSQEQKKDALRTAAFYNP